MFSELQDGPAEFRPAVFSSIGTSPDSASEAGSARARGYAAGYAAGRRTAETDVRALRDRLQRLHDDAEAGRRRETDAAVAMLNAAATSLRHGTLAVVEEASGLLAESALELAEAVLGLELLDGEHGARAAVVRALADVKQETVHAVRLHPQDLAALPDGLDLLDGIRLVPDHGLERGDAITEFDDGFLDARIREALQRCRAVLRGSDS